MFPIEYFLLTAAALFSIGLAVIVTKRNAIMVLIGIELILNSANLNLVAFSRYDKSLSGNMFALFVILVAAAEAAVALAIILRVFSYYKTSNVDEVSQIKE